MLFLYDYFCILWNIHLTHARSCSCRHTLSLVCFYTVVRSWASCICPHQPQTWLMTCPHWLWWWFGAITHQVITRANVDQVLWCQITSLGHNFNRIERHIPWNIFDHYKQVLRVTYKHIHTHTSKTMGKMMQVDNIIMKHAFSSDLLKTCICKLFGPMTERIMTCIYFKKLPSRAKFWFTLDEYWTQRYMTCFSLWSAALIDWLIDWLIFISLDSDKEHPEIIYIRWVEQKYRDLVPNGNTSVWHASV